jgi:hypothetical protein
MKNIMKILPMLAIVAVVMAPVAVLALENPTPPLSGDPVTLRTIEDIINRIAQFLIVFGVILAVIFIIWGGISWMAAGGDDDKVGKAKSRITNGIIGAAIVLGVGVILQTLSSLISRSFFR